MPYCSHTEFISFSANLALLCMSSIAAAASLLEADAITLLRSTFPATEDVATFALFASLFNDTACIIPLMPPDLRLVFTSSSTVSINDLKASNAPSFLSLFISSLIPSALLTISFAVPIIELSFRCLFGSAILSINDIIASSDTLPALNPLYIFSSATDTFDPNSSNVGVFLTFLITFPTWLVV